MILPIESKMEIFARTYSKDTDVKIKMGDKFATDGKNIYVVPVSDQADEWIRFLTEIGVYHETGHIKTKDFPTFKKIKHKTKQSIFNVVRDICIENKMETIYPGMKSKWQYFISEYVKLKTNEAMKSPLITGFKKLMWALYIRAREQQLGIDSELEVPTAIEEIFQNRLAQFVDTIVKHKTIKESSAITEEIFNNLQMEEPEDPEPQAGQGNSQSKSDKSEDDSDEENSSGSGSSDKDQDDSDDKDTGDSDKNEDNPDKSDDKTDKDDNGNDKDDDGDDKDDDGDDKDDDGDDKGGNGDDKDDGDDKDENENESGKSDPKNENEDDDKDKPELSDDAKKALKEAQEEMDDGIEDGGVGEEIADDINEYADTNVVYRDLAGLKDRIIKTNPKFGWEFEVARYEDEGRRITGYSGTKLKMLFISEKAPVWHRHQRSGKLDLKSLYKLKQGSEDVCKRKIPSVLEDSAVSLVIDNSSSMNLNNKAKIAQSLLTSISSDLDRIRIPFEAVGFTNRWSTDSRNDDGIRTMPSDLNLMKSFDEHYRKIRHRFVWPTVNNYTAELPAIIFAAKRLAVRRETKKVLFILTDGETVTGNNTLDDAMHQATREFIDRLKRAGIKVVLIGILDENILDYGEDAILISDMSLFANEFYGKLMTLLL